MIPLPSRDPAPVHRLEEPDVETSSEGYAHRFSGQVGRYFLEVQAAITLEMLAPFPGARVLDVGGRECRGFGQAAVQLILIVQ